MGRIIPVFAAAGWAEDADARQALNEQLWFGVVLLAIWLAAFLVVAAKNFRLTMKHPPQKRSGVLYGTAVGILFIHARALAIGWLVSPVLKFFGWQ